MNQLKLALQLYSVRKDMEADLPGTLKKVKEMGYNYVEFAGYFGRTADEIKDLLERNGLECISVHQVYDVFLSHEEEAIQFIKTIGAKYCAIPWMGAEKHKGTDQFENVIQEIIHVGSILKAANIQLLYHNHEFEFEKFDDKFLLDWLYDSVPSEILAAEVDTCWVKYAGQDPCSYIRKYSGRSPIVHFKDFISSNSSIKPVYTLIDEQGNEIEKSVNEEVSFAFKPLGCGVQDFKKILEAAIDAHVEVIVVEQDDSHELQPLEAAKISREYLRTIGI